MDTQTKKLYDNFLEGKATREEITKIYDRITTSPEDLREFREYERFWEQVHKPSDEVMKSLRDFKDRVNIHKRRRFWRFASGIAAAAVLCAVIVRGFHPDMDKGAVPSESIQEYVVNVPAGGRTDVSLPDGTRVTLNAGSCLSYTSEFNKSTRDVTLSGEGYFEVARDEDKPFNVNAGKCTVTVLGTKFDISAYEQDDEAFTALVEGSVVFKAGGEETVIAPGELVTYGKDGLKKETADVRDYCGWISGIIKYNNIQFSALLKRLEREYDTKFILEDGVLGERNIRVSFSKNDSVDTIMQVLSDILPISVRKGKNVYYVNHKNTTNNNQ